ncbi:MAG: tetratricopeptide repeat protein, partial [Hyphomicrobiales bacterium]
MRIAFKLFGFVWALATSSLALAAEQAAPPAATAGSGRIVVAQMECGVCKASVQKCFSPCESMPKSPRRKECFDACKVKKSICASSCGGKPIDLNTTVQQEVSAEEARKQALGTRERLVSALPPDIGDVTAILDQQKADPAKAEEDRRTADAEPPAGLSKGKLAEFYARRGLAAGEIGRAEQAVADLRKSVDLAKGVDTETYKSALWDLGHAEGRIGRIKEAIAMREEYVKLPMRNGERLAKSCILAISYAGAGDLAKANARMKTAEDLLTTMHRADKKSRDKFGNIWLGRAKRAKGDIFMVEGRYGEAEQMFRDAIYLAELDIKRGEDEKYAAAARDQARMRLAEAMVRQNRLVEAEIEIRKVLLDTLARAGRYSTETPRVLTRFSQILVAQGRFAEAEKLAVAAIETMQAMAFPEESFRMVAAKVS